MKLPTKEPPESPDAVEENGVSNGNSSHGEVHAVPEAVHDAVLQNAIDAMFRSPEETYEQLISNFPHLTMADIAQSYARNVFSDQPVTAQLPAVAAAGSDGLSEVAQHQLVPTVQENTVTKLDDDQDLPEEILGEGTVNINPLLRRSDVAAGSTVKVDNFVTFEDDSDTEDDLGSSYQASFCAPKECVAVRCESPKLKTPDEPNDTKDTSNISERSNKNSEKYDLSLNADKWKTFCQAESDGEEFTYNAELDEVNPGEIDTSAIRPQNIVKHATHLEFKECRTPLGSGKGLEAKTEGVTNSEAGTDRVEAFKLDEDFDYDHVILTPKFLNTEIAHLMQSKSTELQVPYAPGQQDEMNLEEEDAA